MTRYVECDLCGDRRSGRDYELVSDIGDKYPKHHMDICGNCGLKLLDQKGKWNK